MVRKCHRVTKVKKKKKKSPLLSKQSHIMRRVFGFSVSRRVLGWFRVLCLVQQKSEQHRRGFRWRANCSTTKTETSYCWRWNNNDKKKEKKKDAELNNHCGLLKRILLLHACLCPALMCWWLKKKKKKKVSSVFKTSPWVLNRGSGLNRKSS